MDAPPSYEQFTIEDPNERGAHGGAHGTGYMRRINKMLSPVMRVVDPVARKWAELSTLVEAAVSRVMDPLLAKRIFFLISVIVVVILLYLQGSAAPVTFEQRAQVSQHLFDEIRADRIRHTAEYLNSFPHVAGTVSGRTTAQYIHDALASYGIERVDISSQQTFLTHANKNSLTTELDGKTVEIDLGEDQAISDRDSGEQPAPHMALGLPGSCQGNLVYANYGSRLDLNRLFLESIELKDKVVAVRYGRGTPGQVVQRLADRGAVGVIFFSYKEPGVEPWPEGPDYSESSVQRASLGIPQLWPGDPLSPGWPSSHHLTVPIDNVHSIPKIPVVSMSWKSIGPLLARLKGHGYHCPPEWENNGYPREVQEWWTGDGSKHSPVVSMNLDVVKELRHNVYNVLARIPGTEPSGRGVFIGASHDSFCYGGVKLSGASVLLEVARALSYLSYEYNWKPLRSIYFTFWDASTQNYAGATEWMESLAGLVNEDGIIYIDLDKGVSGDEVFVEGDPSIDVRDIIAQIDDALTVDPEYRRIPHEFGTHDVFSSLVGVPAISLSMAKSSTEGSVYPKDSCFDTLDWQARFGDKDFSSHKKLGDIVTAIAYKYADSPVMPFNFTYFASQVNVYLDDLEEYLSARLGPSRKARHNSQLSSIREGLEDVSTAGQRAFEFAHSWQLDMAASPDNKESNTLRDIRLDWNDRMDKFSKRLLHRSGMYHREWFKNLLFGPKYEADMGAEFSGTFPGVRDIVWLQMLDSLDDTLQLVADAVKDAAQVLLDAPYWN